MNYDFSIDNFIKTILEYRHQALEPIIINENDLFTLKKSFHSSPDTIYSLFYIHGYEKKRESNIHQINIFILVRN